MIPETMDGLFLALELAKKRANQAKEMQDLTGIDHDSEENPIDPYKELEDLLVKNLEDVRMLRAHKHQWSEETDLCSICGADGRA